MAGTARVKEVRRLHIRDIGAIVAVLSLVGGIVAWAHSAVTVPLILNESNKLIEKAIDRHAKMPHPVSVSKETYQRDVDRLFQRLDRHEILLQKLVAGN